MESIAQIKKLSLWIFIIPFVAINLCLFISVNYQIFDNTFLSVDQIGRTNPTFPYFDGGVSISRTARTYPAYLVFKPSMIFASILLIRSLKTSGAFVFEYSLAFSVGGFIATPSSLGLSHFVIVSST